MEQLENELDLLIRKLKNSEKFSSEIDTIQNVYPFNRYEYILIRLVEEKILTYEDYLDLRNDYINRNLFLYVFEISAPRGFGDTWGFSHLLSVEPELKRPSRKTDSSYKGQYDLYLPYMGNNIKIEVKGSRAVDRNRPNEPLYMKALSSTSEKDFLMNFQQVKPTCCDVMLWFAVYRDCVKYWVLKNTDIYDLNFSPQHRNAETEIRKDDYKKTDIYEGQVMITRENISSIRKFEVEGRALRQAIIERFES
ncbi:hypothetical protein [Treponema berlinense]|uniref:hypothetical protein n=1 Tax=Treponema berlinense TaxID=225004 RepID=UPI0026EF3A0C|nr:hypothetical protein [Treponema berlinense]